MSVVSGAVGRRRLLAVPHRRDLHVGRDRGPAHRRLPAARGDRGSRGLRPHAAVGSGGVIMASANDLIVMFLGLEILSIAVYVLAGMHLRRLRSGEAAHQVLRARRLLLGVLPVRHRARLRRHRQHEHGARSPTSWPPPRSPTTACSSPGFGLLLVGFGFKIAAVPFHSWAPDVYQGSPSPIVAYMASGVKAAGFAGLLRVFVVTFGSYRLDWQPIVYWLAILSLLVGAVLAIVQTDVKRMLAYSSINHAGFILVGVEAASADGVAGRSSTWPPTRSWWAAPSASSPWSGGGATGTTTSGTTGGCRDGSRSSRSPSPCSCWPRRARPSPRGSSPSST